MFSSVLMVTVFASEFFLYLVLVLLDALLLGCDCVYIVLFCDACRFIVANSVTKATYRI